MKFSGVFLVWFDSNSKEQTDRLMDGFFEKEIDTKSKEAHFLLDTNVLAH